MISKPRLLIVEDVPAILDDLYWLFSSPSSELVEAYGVPTFDVDSASTGVKARELLAIASKDMRPYDVLILDIGMPENGSSMPDINVGIGILKAANERSSAAVVIQSVHTEVQTFVELIRSRASDFIAKPFESEEVFRTVVQAFKTGQERLRRRWSQVSSEHLEKWRLVQARAQVADHMAEVLTNGTSKVLDRVSQLSQLLEDRYQLNPTRDCEDPTSNALAELKRAAVDTSRAVAEARETVSPALGRDETVNIEASVAKVAETLSTGFAVRRLVFEVSSSGEHTLETASKDMDMILEELIFNAIEASRENAAIMCKVSSDGDPQTVNVSVSDQAEPIPAHIREQIRDGRLLKPDAGRGWGLSLAQRVARYVLGGHIAVESTESENTVTLRLPV